MKTYLIDDAATLPDNTVADIHRRLEDEGWIVIQTPPGRDLEEALLALQAILGGVVYHPYSKEGGVVIVDNAYRPPRGMLPHTDGTYYPQPPALMCLQCVTAASTGGASTLVDGAKIYDYIRRELADDLSYLFEPVMSVRREDHSVESPVFWRTGERVRIRFRIDETIKLDVAPRARRVVEVIRDYVADPVNQIAFTLQPGQTLIVDNTRMLHGRTAYDGREQRKMNRMHLDGETPRGTLRLGFVTADSLLNIPSACQ